MRASKVAPLWQVLAEHRDFRLLWSAQLVSGLGDWLARLALASLVYARTGSASTAALAVAASLVAWLGPGQLVAGLGDRFPRRRVLVCSDLAGAAAFLCMLLPLPTAGLLALALVAGLTGPPFASARAALLPDLVPRDRYPDAVAVSQATEQVSVVAGYAAAGLLLTAFSPEVCLAVNGASFVLSASLIARISLAETARLRRKKPVREAARFLLGDRLILLAVILTCLTGAAAMAVEALVVPVGASAGGAAVTALLAVAVPVGTLAATMRMPRSPDPMASLRTACAIGASGCLAGAILFAVPHTAGLVGGFLAAGAVFAVTAPTNVVIAPRLPDQLRATAFGLLLGALVGSQALGAALGAVVAGEVGAQRTCAGALLLGLAASWGCRLVVRAWSAEAPATRPVPVPRPRPPAAEDVPAGPDRATT